MTANWRRTPETVNPRNVLCPKCWTRDPQNIESCGSCGETGCRECLSFEHHLNGADTLICNHCREREL